MHTPATTDEKSFDDKNTINCPCIVIITESVTKERQQRQATPSMNPTVLTNKARQNGSGDEAEEMPQPQHLKYVQHDDVAITFYEDPWRLISQAHYDNAVPRATCITL